MRAELWAACHGLTIAWNTGFRQITLEVDFELVVRFLKEGVPDHHPHAAIIANCRRLIQQPWHVHVTHTYRECNRVADWLANLSFNLSPGLHILSSPPLGCMNLLLADVSGVCTPRRTLIHH